MSEKDGNKGEEDNAERNLLNNRQSLGPSQEAEKVAGFVGKKGTLRTHVLTETNFRTGKRT